MTQPTKPMSLQPFDPEVFQRVWNRVMPQQELSPCTRYRNTMYMVLQLGVLGESFP